MIVDATLAGERVTLRPVRPADAVPYLQAFADDPGLARNVGFDAPSARQARASFRRDAKDRAAGSAARFAAEHEGAFAGLFLLHSFAWAHRRADCGFMVVPAARGRGIGAEALRLLTSWAFSALSLNRVGLATRTDNVATQRLAERAGYQREGVLRAYTVEWDVPTDHLIFSAVSTAWA